MKGSDIFEIWKVCEDFLSTANGSQIATQMISAFQGLQQQGSKAQMAITKFEKLVSLHWLERYK